MSGRRAVTRSSPPRISAASLAGRLFSSFLGSLLALCLELLHLRRHDLGDGPASATVPEEPPDQMTSDEDGVALDQAVARLPSRLFPGRYREREDSLAGFWHLEAEPGHLIPGRHGLDLWPVGQPSREDDHIDRDHGPLLSTVTL